MKVLYFLRDNGGCGWYRLAQPLQTAALFDKTFEVRHVEKGDDIEKIAELLLWAEVCVLPRVHDEKFFNGLAQFKALGKKIIIDWDDNFQKIDPLSPHYRDFGTVPHYADYKDGKLPVWVDVNDPLADKKVCNVMNIEANKAGIERAKKALTMADMVTTTTDVLADVFREFNPNVKVLPNCIDLELWKELPFQKHEGVRVGWSGGYSHFEDWKILAHVLPEFLRLCPDVTLVLMGQMFKGTLENVDPKRIEYRGWCPTPAYPYVSAILDLDFAMIPLVDSDFNNCKSPIKWLEMAALGVPCVSSYCSPYAEMMDLVRENGMFIEANSLSNWLIALNKMAKEPALRKVMGASARQTVEQYFDIEQKFPLWVDAYKSLVEVPVGLAQ